MFLGGLTNESGSSTSNRYLGLYLTSAPSSTESSVTQIVPVGGKLSNLFVRLGTAPNNSFGTQKYTFTVRKNSSSTGAISCEISEDNKTCSSTSEMTFAAGDTITLEADPSTTNSNNPTGWASLRWGVTLTP